MGLNRGHQIIFISKSFLQLVFVSYFLLINKNQTVVNLDPTQGEQFLHSSLLLSTLCNLRQVPRCIVLKQHHTSPFSSASCFPVAEQQLSRSRPLLPQFVSVRNLSSEFPHLTEFCHDSLSFDFLGSYFSSFCQLHRFVQTPGHPGHPGLVTMLFTQLAKCMISFHSCTFMEDLSNTFCTNIHFYCIHFIQTLRSTSTISFTFSLVTTYAVGPDWSSSSIDSLLMQSILTVA